MALLKHSERRPAVLAHHSCAVSIGLQIIVEFASSRLMGNFVSRVRAFLFRTSSEFSDSGTDGDRFRWVHEQGRDQLHLAEGGPLFRRLGTWPFDQCNSPAGKYLFVFLYTWFVEKRGRFAMIG